MSKNINVNPDHYKVAGRERQGEGIVQKDNKRRFTEAHDELSRRSQQRSESLQGMADRATGETTQGALFERPVPPAPKRSAKKKARTGKATAKKAAVKKPATKKAATKKPATQKRRTASRKRAAGASKATTARKRPARKK